MKIFIGLDDGHKETKVSTSTGIEITIPSQAKAGEDTNIAFANAGTNVATYETNEGVYTVGNIKNYEPTSSDSYATSALNRVIVTHALVVAGVPIDAELMVVSGLPLFKFYSGKEISQLVQDKKTNLLNLDAKSKDVDKPYNVVSHEVVAEGIAAWIDFVTFYDDDNVLTYNDELMSDITAVIDIGGRTTELAVIENGVLDTERSRTFELGVLNVVEMVKQQIEAEHDTTLDLSRVTKGIEDGYVKIWGGRVSIAEAVRKAETTVLKNIESEIRARLKDASDLDHVLFVGGGCKGLKVHQTKWFKHQKIADAASYSNARGMRKFAELMMQD